MARKTASRLELRRQTEAAEKRDGAGEKETKKKSTRKKAAAPRAKRKVAAPSRKRVVWAIFSGSMKEEARFPYADRALAEEKLEQLRAKGKKMYFIQPLKEDMSDGGTPAKAAKAVKAKSAKPVKVSEEEE